MKKSDYLTQGLPWPGAQFIGYRINNKYSKV